MSSRCRLKRGGVVWGRQIQDRSLVWNTDLIETLELQNCLDNAMITMCVGRASLH